MKRRFSKKGRHSGSYQNHGNYAITKFIADTNGMSQSTAYEYSKRLSYFEAFMSTEYKTGVDSIIEKINSGTYDPYDILSNYRTFLQNNRNISNTTLKQEIITIKNFLEYSDVNISPRKFKLNVK